MPSSRAPLIARLRRYLAVAAWSFAFIIGGQSIFAATCVADGLNGSAGSRAVAVEMRAMPVAEADVSLAAACWHAEDGECHCACAHASGLPAVASVWDVESLGSGTPIADLCVHYLTRLATELRPPIA